MKLKKKTINLLTVCGSCAVILGMGIGGVAYSVSNKPLAYTISYPENEYLKDNVKIEDSAISSDLNKELESNLNFSISSYTHKQLNPSDFDIITINDPNCEWNGHDSLYNLSFFPVTHVGGGLDSSDSFGINYWKLKFYISSGIKGEKCTFYLKIQNNKNNLCSNTIKLTITFFC